MIKMITMNKRKVKLVKELNIDDLELITTDFVVKRIKDDIGKKAKGYDCFFINVIDGELKEVWGVEGIPYPDSYAHRIL